MFYFFSTCRREWSFSLLWWRSPIAGSWCEWVSEWVSEGVECETDIPSITFRTLLEELQLTFLECSNADDLLLTSSSASFFQKFIDVAFLLDWRFGDKYYFVESGDSSSSSSSSSSSRRIYLAFNLMHFVKKRGTNEVWCGIHEEKTLHVWKIFSWASLLLFIIYLFYGVVGSEMSKPRSSSSRGFVILSPWKIRALCN